MKKKENLYNWYIIDASNKIVGRLASHIIKFLSGKNNIEYTPNIYKGDYIIIINSDKLVFSRDKLKKKIYFRHSGYIGGLKSITAKEQFLKDSRKILFLAIKGMLPKNRLGKKMLNHLKIYKNNFHKHISQKPQLLIF